MSNDEDQIVTDAASWHAASAQDSMDWTGFTAWLEADPRHACAYDQVALTDSLLDDHRETLRDAAASMTPAEPETGPEERVVHGIRWGRWAGAALAASLAGVLLVPQFLHKPAVYVTQAHARDIALEDGSTVTLAPHSQLTVAGRSQDRIALAGGAWFHIKHNPDRPLAISAGELQISDIGTSFDVQTDAKDVRVGVAEGEVTVASEALSRPIRLEHGRSLLFDSVEGTAFIQSQSAQNIGAWRSGRLSYDETPLVLVLADLSRYAGVRVKLSDALRDRRFSGSLIISDGAAAIRDLAEVMDLELDRSGDSYRLGERNR